MMAWFSKAGRRVLNDLKQQMPSLGAGRTSGSRTAERLRETFLRYGKVGLVVHICLSSLSLVSCYTAVRCQLPVDRLLQAVGLGGDATAPTELTTGEMSVIAQSGAGVGEDSVDRFSAEASGHMTAGSTAVVAFMLHKALMPLRVPITAAVTPLAARAWARLRPRGTFPNNP
ncbi:unnamed protein product [Polarella glacialis]|uniref:DUF1279 domain-containing protein n=1 Tax=Polarella glacialis TaxID=89957 RepID=A0A813GMA4_POLGL|nr:unnamed protein product [Polarella glacialis]